MSLFGLSDRGKEFRTVIKGAIEKGLGANRTINLLKATYGRAYQRTTFLSDYRILSEAKTVFEPMKYIRKDHTLSERHYKLSSKKMERNYATVVDYTYKLRGETEVRQSYYTIRHDTLLKRGEIEDTIKSAIEREYEVVDVDVLAPREGYKSLA